MDEIKVKLPPSKPVPERLDCRQVVLLPGSLNDKLVEMAKGRGNNVSGFLRNLIGQVVENGEKEKGRVRH